VGEPAGRYQEGPAQRLGHGLLVADAQAEGGGPAQQIVGQGGGQQPGRVGGEPARGQVGQPGARLQVADGQLANGVAAVVGVQLNSRADAVGDEGVLQRLVEWGDFAGFACSEAMVMAKPTPSTPPASRP
jgi:hypothetical protein